MKRMLYLMIVSLLIISISIAGIKRGSIKTEDSLNRNVTQIINQEYVRNYEATLGPYFQLWHNAGYTYIGRVKKDGRYLSDTEIGDLAEEYYRSGASNYWNFDDWLISKGYQLEDFRFRSERVLDKARELIYDAGRQFTQEVITAFMGYNFSGVITQDWERTSWPGRQTGIFDIKSGNVTLQGTKTNFYTISEGDINLNVTETRNLTARLTYKVDAVVMQSPIVLDLNGDEKLDTYKNHHLPLKEFDIKSEIGNVKLQEFDISGFGYKALVEHIGKNDGYLVKIDNYEKTIKTGIITANEMFGTAGGYKDGFHKLSTLDTNNDQKITDDELNNLYVFQDKDMDFKIDKGELKSVKDLGITEININHTDYESYYVRNGKKYKLWDFWPITINVRKVKN